MNRMDEILHSIPSLPPLPQTAQQLMTMIPDPDVDAEKLAEVIQYDQNITTTLLRLVNSSYYSKGGSIRSVKEAVVRLGRKTIGEIILMATCGGVLNGESPGYQTSAGGLWKHSVGAAVAAAELARLCPEASGKPHPDAFTAGLLHDVGKVVLDLYVEEEQGALIRNAEASGVGFCEAEKQQLGIDHADVGSRILELWNFPEEIVKAVRYHHEPEKAEEATSLVAIVHVADTVCLSMGIGLGCDGLLYAPSLSAMAELDMERKQFDALCAETIAALQEIERQFKAQ